MQMDLNFKNGGKSMHIFLSIVHWHTPGFSESRMGNGQDEVIAS